MKGPKVTDKKDYKVGDVACLTNCEMFPEYDDTECLIVRGYLPSQIHNSDTMELREETRYIVVTHDGRRLGARKDQLKPRMTPPPVIAKEKVEA